MEACYFVSWGAQSLAWTHALPLLIAFGLWVASFSKDGIQWVPKVYGLFLLFCDRILLAIQTNYAVLRPDPYCAHVHTYAFPSMEAFYVASLGTFLITYTFAWGIPLSWVTWLMIYTFFVVPPFILNWFLYNRIGELLVSMALGIVVTTAYVTVLRLFIYPLEPYLLNQAPWTWMHCVDTIGMGDHGQRQTENVKRILQKLNKLK